MSAKIKAEPIHPSQLKPGDLFALAGQSGSYEGSLSGRSAGFGTSVYIRSNNRFDGADFPPTQMYRITVEQI